MMKNIKSIALLLTMPLMLFSFSNCVSTQNTGNKLEITKNAPFKIAEAYYQNWIAGVKEGGSGTNIYLVFDEMEPNVIIQNIYFKNHILEAKGNINEPNQYVGYLKNETHRDVIMDSDPMKEAQNSAPKLFPFQLEDNQAVVEYWFGGKKNYFKIENLSKKEMIPYPQANPNSHE